MQLVIDANILIAGFLKSAVTRELLMDDNIELFAPEYFSLEVERKFRRDSRLRKKIKLGQVEIEELLAFLMGHITILPEEEYSSFLAQAKAIVPFDDAPYLALSLALTIPLWSNDSALKKQRLVMVYTTSELIKLL